MGYSKVDGSATVIDSFASRRYRHYRHCSDRLIVLALLFSPTAQSLTVERITTAEQLAIVNDGQDHEIELVASIELGRGAITIRKGQSVKITGKGATWAITSVGGRVFTCRGKLTLVNVELYAGVVPSWDSWYGRAALVDVGITGIFEANGCIFSHNTAASTSSNLNNAEFCSIGYSITHNGGGAIWIWDKAVFHVTDCLFVSNHDTCSQRDPIFVMECPKARQSCSSGNFLAIWPNGHSINF